ncbi:hypothetical protein [Pararhizobium antarcticum]|uniref:Glycosyltransferase 2-like domain-containing protein n=1 Tax=Pararhizobium antarcticum TaxID=1798805 RepID=A0A657LXX1_9HYPH|nr:hypothetical protein [Pararhizobium antarcticum]OJF98475.1 hypothetical protein AX761_01685 [Rhizobium sp. 58]OJG00993.1 hypothetical protein AX760_09185 [Pararhizobium antarcticum]
MTKLSICIPVETAATDPVELVSLLLRNSNAALEVVVAGAAPLESLVGLAASDSRLRIIRTEADITRQRLWRRAVAATSGEWVTLVNPGDMIEPELATMVGFLDQTSSGIDALAWNVFQIDHDAEPGKSASIAIPAGYQINTFDKTAMLKSFFYWENSLNTPKMPFGLYHAAIRRSLVDILLQHPEPSDWATTVPHYEWATKVLLFSESLAFCSRPMSAAATTPYVAEQVGQAWNFPFHGGIGLTGAIADVQFHVLRELGTPWSGGNEAFVRALVIDCMMETTRDAFRAKGNAYFAGLQAFEDGRLAPLFKPEFVEARKQDNRRGLHDSAVLVDRFIGGARTAPEFYNVVKSMMAPVGLICGGTTASA